MPQRPPTDASTAAPPAGLVLTRTERLSTVPSQMLAATLDLPAPLHPVDTLPPLWHQLHFPDLTPSAELGPDGAPREQPLFPPTDAEQIMWAGARYDFHVPLAYGVDTEQASRLAGLTKKPGTRGEMLFASFATEYRQHGRLALTEEVRLVFLGAASDTPPAAVMPPAPRLAERLWPVDEVRLFRFSALTFNPHRIHYDRHYTTEVAGYPELIVHGPLQALLIAESLRAWHPREALARLEFRARAPLVLGTPVRVAAGTPEADGRLPLWTEQPSGAVAMQAHATFAR